MKIVELRSENVKRLSAVEIKPDGSLVVVGGANGAGKSSVLDSIMYALGGKDTLPSRPVRSGASKARITVDLGDLIVERTITAEGGGALKVKNKDGAAYPSPQAMLDSLCGRLAFDPLEFSRLKPGEQVDALKGLLGLDFSVADAEIDELYSERTGVNRDAKAIKARLDAMPKYDDALAEEVNVADLLDELERRQALNRAKFNKEQEAKTAEHKVAECVRACRGVIANIEELERQLASERRVLASLESDRQECEVRAEHLQLEAKAMAEAECTEIHEQISAADSVNRKVRANAERAKLAAEFGACETQAQQLTAGIDAIEADKAAKVAAANFPVEGLGFNDTGITFESIPFDQCSSAERLRVSVAMGLAMNPKLRVMLIRDGSLLDVDSLAMVADMAAAADGQVWLERVGTGEECSVIIENGAVAQPHEAEPALA